MPTGALWTLGDARGGAGAAGASMLGPGGGRGRSAGDRAATGRRVRHRRRRGRDGGAAAGLARPRCSRTAASRAPRRRPGPSGRWRSTTRIGADRLVAEVNQGGELVAQLIRQVDPMVPFRAVRARRGKVVRAEPVAALYEQGRVGHRGVFPALEDQMAAMTVGGFVGTRQPRPGRRAGLGDDRADDRSGGDGAGAAGSRALSPHEASPTFSQEQARWSCRYSAGRRSRRPRPRPRRPRRWWPFRARAGRPGRRATPRR